MDQGTVKYRIGWVSALLVVGVAIVADLLQVVLALTVVLSPAGDFVAVIGEGMIFIYFIFRGVKFIRGKGAGGRMAGLVVTSVIELIPIVDALPTITLFTLYTIHSSRKEDREAFKLKQEQQGKAAAEQQSQDQALQQAYYVQQMRLRAANDRAQEEEGREAA